MEVYELLNSETMSDGYVLALKYQENDEVKAACDKYGAVYSAAEEVLDLLSSQYGETTYEINGDEDGWWYQNGIDDLNDWISKNKGNGQLRVEVKKDASLNGGLIIPADANVVVVSAGGILRRSNESAGKNANMFQVYGNLTLSGITVRGCYDNNQSQNERSNQSIVSVENGGTLIMDSGSNLQQNQFTEGNGKGGAVYVKSGGELIMNGGAEIKDCYADEGGAIYLERGAEATVNSGASVSGWSKDNNTVAVYVAEGATLKDHVGISGVYDVSAMVGDYRLDNKKIVVTVIKDAESIPNEPTVSGHSYVWVTGNYKVGATDEAFSNNAAEYISPDIFKDPNYKINGGAQGVSSSASQYVHGIDWDGVLDAVVKGGVKTEDGTTLTEENKGKYKVYPYVVKLQNTNNQSSDGWHIDCMIIPKDRSKLIYELNLQGLVDNLEGFLAPDGRTYDKGTEVSVESVKYSNSKVEVGQEIEVKKDGHDAKLYFLGWSTSSDGQGTIYKPDDKLTINEDTTLYGVWTTEYQKHDISYTVKYYKDNVEVENDTETVTKNVLVNQTELAVKEIDKNKYVSDNYAFDHYEIVKPDNTSETKSELPQSVEKGTVIKVYYKSTITTKQYTVEYYKDTVLEDTEIINVEGVSVDATELTVEESKVNTTKYNGYVLDYINTSGNIKVPQTVEVNGTIKVYFTPIEYNITYELDGGAFEGGNNPNPQTYKVTDTITFAEKGPVKGHHTFLGWVLKTGETYEEKPTKEFGPGVTGNRTYKAVWQEDQKYLLTIKSVKRENQNETVANDITTGNNYYAGTEYTFKDVADENKEEITFQIGEEEITIPKIIKISGTEKKQYIYDSGAEEGTISSEGENVVTLVYALDENGNNIPDYQEHNVTYDLNDGTVKVGGEDITGPIVHESVKRNTTVNISDDIAVVPTKVVKDLENKEDESQRYVFAGWKPIAGSVKIANNQFTMPDENVILQAQWKGMTISKIETSTRPESGNGYAVGSDVTFTITVTNSGDVDLTNVVVTDKKSAAKITSVKINGKTVTGAAINNNTVTLSKLEPKDIASIEVTYTVTADDKEAAKNDGFTNQVTAETGDDDGKVTVEDETPDIPIEGVEKHLTVTKAIRYGSEEVNGKKIPIGASGTDKNGQKNGLFKEDDWVTFDVTIRNDGKKRLENITVEDLLPKAVIKEENKLEEVVKTVFSGIIGKVVAEADQESSMPVTIVSLDPGEVKTYTVTYKIKDTDIGRNFANVVRATAVDGTTNEGESEPVPVEQPDKKITIAKQVKNQKTDNEGKYSAGEYIEYEITVTNEGNVALEGVTVQDKMTAVENGTKTEISPEWISGNTDLSSGEPTYYGEGVTWDSATKTFTIAKIEKGNSATISYRYQVQPEDAGKTIHNEAVGKIDDTDPGTGPVSPGTDPVVEKRSLTVKKELLKADDTGAYTEEELKRLEFGVGTLTFRVTVTNNGNVTLENVKVTDKMWAMAGENKTLRTATLAEGSEEQFALEAGKSKVVTYTYLITEDDLGCELYNAATASGENASENPDEVKDGQVGPIKVQDRDPKVSVVKSIVTDQSSAPDAETGMYKKDDVITYQIVVTNEGNIELRNVVVKDTMTGATGKISVDNGATCEPTSDGYNFIITDPIPVKDENGNKGSVVITYKYVVQSNDAGKTIGNTAVIENIPAEKDPENPDPVEVEKRELTVDKTIVNALADGEKYQLGDEIIFAVTVTNSGNVAMKDITLTDTMLNAAGEAQAVTVTGDAESGYETTPVAGGYPAFDLAPNASVIKHYSYIVQETDMKDPNVADAVSVLNKVTAKAGDGTEGTKTTDPIPVGDQAPAYTVKKDIVNINEAENGKFKAGDRIRYSITVENTGNVALKDITVGDTMTGAAGEIDRDSVEGADWDGRQFTIKDSIPVKDVSGNDGTATITYEYEVLDADAGKTISNTVTGGPGQNPDDPDKEKTVEIEKRQLTVEKNLINQPANGIAFVKDETMLFSVSVQNTGNVDLTDIEVTDEMQNATGDAQAVKVSADGAGGYVIDEVVAGHTINSLPAGSSATVYYSYTVQEADLGKTDVRNRAIATSKDNTPDDTTDDTTGEDTTEDLPVGGEYTLTVRYEYQTTGAVAAAAYTAKYTAGTEYLVYSPTVSGYDSSAAFVTGKMPCRNLELVVYYTASGTTDNPGGGGGGGNDEPTPPTPPTPPVGPVPVTPTPVGPTPVTPTPTGAIPVVITPEQTLAEVGDEAVPLQGALIDVDDDGNVVVTTIDEEEVPLAGGVSDDHKCCILSFLLMLAALIIYTWYTYDMKKRQKRLAELADELEEETMKKQLGMAGAKQAK